MADRTRSYAENVPGAQAQLAEFDRMQKEDWELDIDKDILSLLAGGHTSVSMDDNFVLMFRVTDEEKTMQPGVFCASICRAAA